MPFPTRTTHTPPPEDPESLYRELAETNRGPKALWTHQGQVLQDWVDHEQDRDVAIELPTGAGKTLVGGLIAEYRRRVHRERVAIACPTRQLARQTATRLSEYGIPNVLLVNKVATWASADRTRYQRADAVAVTVYQHVFNSNPAINDAELLVFDDAHAAEQAVISPWTISVERDASLYQDLLAVLGDALDPLVLTRMRNDGLDPRQKALTYLASPAGVAQHAETIEDALRDAATNGTGPSNLSYALSMMQGHIGRALVYVSHRSILIRPLIAPTSTHDAFDRPRQRVYMSATLGHGGELERAFGRRRIERIPVPRGWDKQGSGRRFFVLPSLSTDLQDPEQVDAWVEALVARSGRVLMLAASEYQALDLIERVVPESTTVLRADDVEDHLSTFTQAPNTALILANRYDGIDLPDDDCRLVLFAGLPARGDLQERFLHDSLGAIEVLRERMGARFAQGAGRATRNVKDHAAVVLLGDELLNYVAKREVAAALHPELQAELSWAFDESATNTADGLQEDLGHFFAQSPDWQEANRSIIDARIGVQVSTPDGTDALAAAAPLEVQAWTAAWQGDWDNALIAGRRIIDALSGGRDVQRYAALWHYILACWTAQTPTASQQAIDQFLRNARAAGRGTTWLDHLVAPADDSPDSAVLAPRDEVDEHAVTRILDRLGSTGRNVRFDPAVTEARSGLAGRDAKTFEDGLVFLGELAGAESEGDGGADSAPDATWRFGDLMWITWEAKNEADEAGEIGSNVVRQAGSHLRYAATKQGSQAPRLSYGILASPQQRVNPAAAAVAEDHLHHVQPTVTLELFDRVLRAWRTLRAQGAGATADSTYEALKAEQALPSQWIRLLTTRPLAPRETDR